MGPLYRLVRRVLPGVLVAMGATLPILAGGAHAQEIQIDAPSFSVDRKTDTYRYIDARVRLGDLVLDAQTIEISRRERTLTATGFVRFRDGPIVGSADSVTLDLKTGTGILRQVYIHDTETGYYLYGEEMSRVGEGYYIARQCRFSTCEPRLGGWSLSASTIEYRQGEYALGTNAVLRIGPVPIFWFPYVAWPAVEGRTSGLLPPQITVQESSLARLNLGARLALPYFYAIGEDHDLTVIPEQIFLRGPALGMEYRYAFREGQRGKLRLWGIREAFPRDPSNENDILADGAAEEAGRNPSRYTLDWDHNQTLGERGRLVLKSLASSDGQVRREYENISEYRPYRVFQGTYSHQGSWIQGAVTVDRQAEFTDESIYAVGKDFTDADERPVLLPRLSFTTGRQPFDSVPLALELDSTLTRFTTEEGLSGVVSTVSPTIGYPLTLLPGLEFRPSLRRNFVQYDSLVFREPGVSESELDSEGYMQDEIELELRYALARVFPREEGTWSDLKHILTPRLIRRTVQDVAQPRGGLVLESQFAQNLLIMRLDNTWMGRRRPGGDKSPVSQLATLNFIQRYNVLLEPDRIELDGPDLPDPSETEQGEPLLPAIVEGTVSASPFKLGFLIRYHHQLARVTETRFGISGGTGSRGRLAIDYIQNDLTYRTPDNKLNPEQTRLGFSSAVTVTEPISMGFNGTINLRREPPPLGRRIEFGETYLDYKPGCYSVRLSYQERLDSTVEGEDVEFFVDRRILLTFNLGNLFSINSSRGITTGETSITPGF